MDQIDAQKVAMKAPSPLGGFAFKVDQVNFDILVNFQFYIHCSLGISNSIGLNIATLSENWYRLH